MLFFRRLKKPDSYCGPWSSFLNSVDYLYNKDANGLVILVMMDTGFKKELALSFIERIKQEFLQRYPLDTLSRLQQRSAIEFKEILKDLTANLNASYSDKSFHVMNQVLALENITVENFTKLAERSSQLDEIKDQVILLSENSTIMKKNAITLRKRTERRYMASICFMVSLILVS